MWLTNTSIQLKYNTPLIINSCRTVFRSSEQQCSLLLRLDDNISLVCRPVALNLPFPPQTFDAIWTDIYALSAGMFMTRQWGMRRAGLSPELRLRTFRRIGFARSAALERSTLRWRCKIEGPGWGPLIV